MPLLITLSGISASHILPTSLMSFPINLRMTRKHQITCKLRFKTWLKLISLTIFLNSIDMLKVLWVILKNKKMKKT